MKKLKEIPNFKNTDQEREFWESKDSADYLDWEKATFAKMPNLKKAPRLSLLDFRKICFLS